VKSFIAGWQGHPIVRWLQTDSTWRAHAPNGHVQPGQERHDTQNIHNLDFDVEGGQLITHTQHNPQQRHQTFAGDFPDLYVSSHYRDTGSLPGDAVTC